MSDDRWNYEKSDLPQGAWYGDDHQGDICAAIFPYDQTQPIEQGNNSRLYTRDFGSDQWLGHGPQPLAFGAAKELGDQHCRQYARDLAKALIQQVADERRVVLE